MEWSSRSPDHRHLDFFFWGMLKEKVYLVKITNLMHLTQRIRDKCSKIEGNKISLHQVHEILQNTLIFALQMIENIMKMLFE